MTKAIDVSAAPPATQDQCDCLKANGVIKAVVGTSFTYLGVPADRIAAFRAGGLIVAEYQFPHRLVTPITDEWWCDVESPPGVTQQQIQDACRRAPRPYGIYSNATMWSACGLDGYDVKAEFPWLKVWMADYGPLPRPFRPFGGFTEDDLAMVQYAGTANVCGLDADMSEIIEELDMPLTAQDKLDIADIVRAEVLKALGTLPDGNGDTFKRNISDLALDGARREVEIMVQHQQVRPPKG